MVVLATAELANAVGSPAVGAPAARHAAGVDPPRAHRGEGEPTEDRHRGRAIGPRAIAELSLTLPVMGRT